MANKVRKQNIFNTIFGGIKFLLFWVAAFVQMPLIFLMPKKWSVKYMGFFMTVVSYFAGIRVRVHGKLTDRRPLMVVSNHISVFEIATFPMLFGGSFVAKKDVESWPIVGCVSRKFGVIFVDRRPSKALEATKAVQRVVETVDYPIFLFPEGTTTNGAYVKKFKSSMFSFVEGSDITVQPVVMHYRYHDGSPISDQDLAEHFAYFNNKDQDMGPCCSRERSLWSQVFHVMMLGGFLVEVTVLPPVPLAGMDRKQIAETLHDIISEKYIELKDKKRI